jgi:hypothetical protein
MLDGLFLKKSFNLRVLELRSIVASVGERYPPDPMEE